jgi:hypothetical protein
MLKLIAFIVAAIPIVLLVKAIFFGKSGKNAKALADFKRQVDYVVWAILVIVACGIVYSLARLVLS